MSQDLAALAADYVRRDLQRLRSDDLGRGEFLYYHDGDYCGDSDSSDALLHERASGRLAEFTDHIKAHIDSLTAFSKAVQ